MKKHGLDFALLNAEFFLDSTIEPAKVGRLKAIGRIAAWVVSVIFVRLGSEGISVISMRPANPDERRLFDGET